MLLSTSTIRRKIGVSIPKNSSKELNALIEKKFRSLLKQEKEEDRKRGPILRGTCRFSTMKTKIVSQAWRKAWNLDKSSLPIPNEKQAWTN